MANGGEKISTIFIGGFPTDALPRELDNLCRFFPGFVTSNVSTAKGVTLFVLFSQPEHAQHALNELNGQNFDRTVQGEPMRAAMARSNMRSGGGPPSVGAMMHVPAAWGPQQTPSLSPAGGVKRPHTPEYPGQVDTVASVGAFESGFDETSLRSFFEGLPGFVDFKGNPRMGGGFAKFASAAFAAQAEQLCKEEGVPAEIAKRSMTSSVAGGSVAFLPAQGAPRGGGVEGFSEVSEIVPPGTGVAGAAGYSWGYGGGGGVGGGGFGGACGGGGSFGGACGGGGKRARAQEDPSSVDTVASVGASEAGFDETSLHSFYKHLPGFVAFKANPRMGGGFAKFASAAMAAQAVQKAYESGIPADIARSSMSVT